MADTTKIQVTLSNKLINTIDFYAQQIGMSRSALCAYWIGQSCMALDNLVRTSNNTVEKKINAELDLSNIKKK